MRLVRLFSWALLLCACAGPPTLPELTASIDAELPLKCRSCFPNGNWQLTHSIEAKGPDGQTNLLMGVMLLSSEPAQLKCALMTIEGFVLFEAVLDENGFAVKRAVPPFDAPAMAQGMLADIQLLFFAPKGLAPEYGRRPDGALVCRRHLADGGVLDLTVHADDSWEMKQYNPNLDLIKTVMATDLSDSSQQRLPKTLKLTTHGLLGYEMTMHLIEALPFNPGGAEKKE